MNKHLSKRLVMQWTLGAIASACMAFGAVTASAQAWPTKPVKVVVPAPAGSSLDVIVRGMAETLKNRWG